MELNSLKFYGQCNSCLAFCNLPSSVLFTIVKFPLGTLEFHGITSSTSRKRGNMVAQRTSTDNMSKQLSNPVTENGSEKYQGVNPYLDSPTDQNAQLTLKHNNHISQTEDFKLFRQALLFPNSMPAQHRSHPRPHEVSTSFNKAKVFDYTKENPEENNLSTQETYLSTNPLPLINGNLDVSRKTLRAPGDVSTQVGTVHEEPSGSFHTSNLQGSPENHTRPYSGILELVNKSTVFPSQFYNTKHNIYFGKKDASSKETYGRIGDSSITLIHTAKSSHFEPGRRPENVSLKTGERTAQSEEFVIRPGVLKDIKPGDKNTEEVHNIQQSSYGKKLTNDENNFQLSVGMDNHFKRKPNFTRYYSFQGMGIPLKNAGKETVLTREGENSVIPSYLLKSSHENRVASNSGIPISRQENWPQDMNIKKQENSKEDSMFSDNAKEEKIQVFQSSPASLQGKGMTLAYNSNSSKDSGWAMQQQYFRNRNQYPLQTPSLSNQPQSGDLYNEKLVTTNEQKQTSTKFGESTTKEKTSTNQQRTQELQNKPSGEGNDAEQKFKNGKTMETERDLKPSAVHDREKSSGKEEQGRTPEEADVFNEGIPRESDVESVSLSQHGEHQRVPSSQETHMETRPDYDSQVFQGISDITQEEDQNTMHKVHPVNQERMATTAVLEHDDQGFSQGNINGNPIEVIQDEKMRQKQGGTANDQERPNRIATNCNSSPEDEIQYKEQVVTAANGSRHLWAAADNYAIDCLCPEKGAILAKYIYHSLE